MATQPHKRRRILMDSFQYRLLGLNLLYFFTILMMTAAMIFVPMMMKLESTTISPAELQQVATLILTLHTWFWPVIIVVFVLLALHSVRVSHRIAGALYRFQAVFAEVADGNLSVRATLRKKDYLTKEAAALTRMIVSLRNKLVTVREHNRDAEQAVSELHRALERGAMQEAQQIMQTAREAVGKTAHCLAQFRLTDGTGTVDHTSNGRADAPAASEKLPPSSVSG